MDVFQPRITPILEWPNKQLEQVSVEIDSESFGTEELKVLLETMFMTMEAHGGVGLSAIQIGIPLNIITIGIPNQLYIALFNPKILSSADDNYKWREGCLSVPGYYEDRERPNKITVEYQDVFGDVYQGTFTDLAAFAIQHEMDHLNGKLFIDGFSKFKQDRIKNTMKKFRRKNPLPL